jgi:hypothetical protein
MHGSYASIEDTPSVDDIAGGVLKNLYVCHKSPFGCISRGHVDINVEMQFKDHIIREMYSSIDRYGSVPFDEIIETQNPLLPIRKEVVGYCRIVDDTLGGAMQNHINPDPRMYINKTYEGSYSADYTGFVIDVETYHQLAHVPNVYQRLMESNILMDEALHKSKFELTPDEENVKYAKLTLADIVEYYSKVKGKTNLFIYDNSCGSFVDESIMPAEQYRQLVRQKDHLKNVGATEGLSQLIEGLSSRVAEVSRKGVLGGTRTKTKGRKYRQRHTRKKNKKNVRKTKKRRRTRR